MSAPEQFIDAGIALHLMVIGGISIGLVVLTALTIAACRFFDWEYVYVIFPSIFAAVTVVVWMCMLIPFDTKYHHIYTYETSIDSVSNVLTEGGGDLTRVPVVMTGDGVQLVVEDPRIVDLEGSDVTFTCSIEWVYAGADRYSCRILAVTS